MKKINFWSPTFQKKVRVRAVVFAVICLLLLGIAFYAGLSATFTEVIFFVAYISGIGALFHIVLSLLIWLMRLLSGVNEAESTNKVS